MVVTYDTNIWVSALTFRKGNAYRLLLLAIEGNITVATSDVILEETRRVLREKFHIPPEDLQQAISIIEGCTHRASPMVVIDAVPGDPSDNRILECAVASGSECIITGDTDLLRLEEFEKIRIIRPADFLALVRGTLTADPETGG